MKSKQSILITCKMTQHHHFWSSTCGRFWFKSSTSLKDTNVCVHADLCFNVSASRRTHRANEGPESGDLLAGDRQMGGLRGKFRPPVWHVGVLAHLLPHLQEPHPAATHHEHRLVRQIGEKKNTTFGVRGFLWTTGFACFLNRGDDFRLRGEDHGQPRWEDGHRDG